MEREIMRDPEFLRLPSQEADVQDVATADDLMDTLRANAEKCVGMAANMIGVNRRIIVFEDKGGYTEMFNPKILRRDDPFETEEGCLSLTGVRKAKRYRQIKVQWQTRDMKMRIRSFTGWTAQIIQHELDHLEGILI